MKEDNIYPSSDVWEWVGIKLEGGPSPHECDQYVVGKMTVIMYPRDELPPKKEIEKHVPSKEALSLYNTYKHDVAFKKVDAAKEQNEGIE